MNRITTIILTTALAAGAQIAHAADPTDDSSRHVTVHFADLDINNVEGDAALYHRLQSAAKSVCSEDEDNTRDLASESRVKTCESKAISDAVTQINRPTLTAYYRAKLGYGL